MSWDDAARQRVTNLGAWLGVFGYSRNSTVMTFEPWVFHPEHVDLRDNWRLAAHERVHWQRQRAAGRTGWTFKYLASSKFRAKEEMHAHLVDLQTGRERSVEECVDRTRRFHRLGCVDRDWMIAWLEKRLPNSAACRSRGE